MSFKIKNGDIENALLIMKEAANRLIKTGKEMWNPEDITKEKILRNIAEKDIYIGYIDDEPAGSMILQWDDKFFWPNIGENESGFIHKLAVRQKYAGKKISNYMVQFAEEECRKRGIKYLRLDCAADRPKLCKFYENLGFRMVDRRMIDKYDTAFYEKKL